MDERFIDITGQKFGKLTAIKYVGNKKWLFKCDCGNDYVGYKAIVKTGRVQSCGCGRTKPKIDIINKRFGRLTAIKYIGRNVWECKCDCGEITMRRLFDLRKADVPSCGCYRHDRVPVNKTHGHWNAPIYRVWNTMCQRCTNPKNAGYSNYGGRGIKVCDRWLGEHGFENFLADMGERPSAEYSIDRIDNNGDYCPENCRWVIWKEQCNNQRRTIHLSHNGVSHSLAEWCEMTGVNYSTAKNRYNRGCNFEEIFANDSIQKKRFTDDEIRFIREHPSQYDYCKTKIGKEFSESMYRQIIRRETYKDVI